MMYMYHQNIYYPQNNFTTAPLSNLQPPNYSSGIYIPSDTYTQHTPQYTSQYISQQPYASQQSQQLQQQYTARQSTRQSQHEMYNQPTNIHSIAPYSNLANTRETKGSNLFPPLPNPPPTPPRRSHRSRHSQRQSIRQPPEPDILDSGGSEAKQIKTINIRDPKSMLKPESSKSDTRTETNNIEPSENTIDITKKSNKFAYNKRWPNASNRPSMQEEMGKDPAQLKLLLRGYVLQKEGTYHEIPIGSPIRYFTADDKFRLGGILTQNCAPKYLRVVAANNPTKTWNVSLVKGTRIYVLDQIAFEQREREKEMLYNDILATGLTHQDIVGIKEGRYTVVDMVTYNQFKEWIRGCSNNTTTQQGILTNRLFN